MLLPLVKCSRGFILISSASYCPAKIVEKCQQLRAAEKAEPVFGQLPARQIPTDTQTVCVAIENPLIV